MTVPIWRHLVGHLPSKEMLSVLCSSCGLCGLQFVQAFVIVDENDSKLNIILKPVSLLSTQNKSLYTPQIVQSITTRQREFSWYFSYFAGAHRTTYCRVITCNYFTTNWSAELRIPHSSGFRISECAALHPD